MCIYIYIYIYREREDRDVTINSIMIISTMFRCGIML